MMGSFPYLPLLAIMASVVSLIVAQVNVFVYAGFMVEHLGAVDDKDKSGKNWRRPTDLDVCTGYIFCSYYVLSSHFCFLRLPLYAEDTAFTSGVPKGGAFSPHLHQCARLHLCRENHPPLSLFLVNSRVEFCTGYRTHKEYLINLCTHMMMHTNWMT